jgi:hypothetical protein
MDCRKVPRFSNMRDLRFQLEIPGIRSKAECSTTLGNLTREKGGRSKRLGISRFVRSMASQSTAHNLLTVSAPLDSRVCGLRRASLSVERITPVSSVKKLRWPLGQNLQRASRNCVVHNNPTCICWPWGENETITVLPSFFPLASIGSMKSTPVGPNCSRLRAYPFCGSPPQYVASAVFRVLRLLTQASSYVLTLDWISVVVARPV